ncbi:MAG: helix-turn-helix transcriptional regulator [Vicinamibacterales bacterium]
MSESDIPRLPAKERLILELLAGAEPKFGLQLVQESDGRLKRGTVYVTLNRLEDKGYVTSHQETPVPGAIGLPRRLYSTTGFGSRVLWAWTTLAQQLATEV